MSFEASLHWRDASANYLDRLIVADAALRGDGRWLRAGDEVRAHGEARLDPAPWLLPANQPAVELPVSAFRLRSAPIAGRCYPRLAFAGLARDARDLRPARVLALDQGVMRVDANHPLAMRDVSLLLRPSALESAPGTRMIDLFTGPGMQTPADASGAAYLAADGVARDDEAADEKFYRQPRFTHHLDAACRAAIGELYGRFLRPGWQVLDLMSSWVSHLPLSPADLHVVGVGLNGEELAANPRLAEYLVKDLNQRVGLPWDEARFDLALCTASIEYLVHPAAVLAEVSRVLKPDGRLVITFSDRWFPSKAIHVWRDLHPFERAGLVLALLRGAGFGELQCETLRGLKRPEDDKYADQRAYADPLFAVSGVRPA